MKSRKKGKSEGCRVIRVYDEALVEIYSDRVVVTTYRGSVVIHCKIESVEDPAGLLEECWW